MRKYLIAILFFVLFGFLADDFYAQQQPTPSPKMTAAGELYKQQKWQEAAAAFGEVTKDEPANGRAWYLLGMSLHSLGKWEQAIAAFEKNVAIAQNPNAMFNIACGYARLNQPDKAFEWLEKSLMNGAAFTVSLETDEDLVNIRKDARFKKMLDLADRQKRPCIYSAEARQFDFWVGDWDVFNPQGQKAGTNSVQLFSDGCGLLENWTSAIAGDGKSINFYDAGTQKWYQSWIGTGGGALRYAGNFRDGAMRFEGETIANGKKTLQKLTFTKIDENTVRQLFEASTDEGKTWTITYDLKYVKKK
ncbi:MAG TPA: tetratricopeptide repeat protein [Pyrinomonadaceae bacterium]|nr:tetratricopeptide repeat protein [Pyrinomonadaceae bacterium]